MKTSQAILWQAIETLEPLLKEGRDAGARIALTVGLNTAAQTAFLRRHAGKSCSLDFDIGCEYVAQALVELRENGQLVFGDIEVWGDCI
jgi:hypothetical protein